MPPRNAPAALNDAYQRLHDAVDRYGPLNRGKGVNSFKGADMIDHQVQGLPLNKLGVMVVAAAKIKQWEAVVGEAYAKKLGLRLRLPLPLRFLHIFGADLCGL